MPRLPTTKLLLSLLASTGQAMIDIATMFYDFRFNRGLYWRGGHALVKEYQRFSKQREVKEILKQLARTKYIKAQKIGNRLMIGLTDKGRAASIAMQLKATKPRDDKLATVVIFDIPQSQNHARRQFRLLLRQGGFTKLQQSVWGSRGDTYHLLAQFIRQLKLTRWVNIFHAKDFLSQL